MTRYKATTYHRDDMTTGPTIERKARNITDLATKALLQGLVLVEVWCWNQGQWWSIPNETVRQEIFP